MMTLDLSEKEIIMDKSKVMALEEEVLTLKQQRLITASKNISGSKKDELAE